MPHRHHRWPSVRMPYGDLAALDDPLPQRRYAERFGQACRGSPLHGEFRQRLWRSLCGGLQDNRGPQRARIPADRLRRDARWQAFGLRSGNRNDRALDGSARSVSLQAAADGESLQGLSNHAAERRARRTIKKPAARDMRGRSNLRARFQLPWMVWITLDIGRASSSPPPISLSTMATYSFCGSIGVLPTTCTTL